MKMATCGLRALDDMEMDFVAGGLDENEGAEIVVTAHRLHFSEQISLSGGGGGGGFDYRGMPFFGGGSGNYSVTYWDTDAFITEYFENGEFKSLEADYVDDLGPDPWADNSSLFAGLGFGFGRFNVGAAISLSPFDGYLSTAYGTPGPSIVGGYTNNAEGYLTGDGASFNTPGLVGYGRSLDGQSYAYTIGTPGGSISHGWRMSDAIVGAGGWLDRFIMEN